MIWLKVIPTRLLVEMAIALTLGIALYSTWNAWLNEREAFTTYRAQVEQQGKDRERIIKEQKAVQEARNAATLAELQTRLDGVTASRDGLTRRLRDALSRSCPVPKTSDQPAATDPTGTQSQGRLSELLSSRLAECENNELRFSALQEEVRGQL